jgi:hypothetical protein
VLFVLSFITSPPVWRRWRRLSSMLGQKGTGEVPISDMFTAGGIAGRSTTVRDTMNMDMDTVTNNQLACKIDALEAMLQKMVAREAHEA